MYRSKDRRTQSLFPELFPFGGKLDENNRWLRIAELIPWEELEEEYAKHFSDRGRPAKDAQLVIGLLLLKHMTVLSDVGIVEAVQENPYMQAFCGFEKFVTGEMLDPSTLTKQRERLGLEFFKTLEAKTYKVLIDRKIIRAKGMLVDATVFPENIKYPNDVGLLNDVREWLVRNIKKLGKITGKQYRTYSRTARKDYLDYSKKKKKTKKTINKAKKKMLQYVRRNLKQIHEVIEIVKACGQRVKENILARIPVAERIYAQQLEMYKQKTHRVADRIVSFHRPYVRPIKRGKSGKSTEFGGKGALSHVDGFLFLDHFEHSAFPEDKLTMEQVKAYKQKFGKLPPYMAADRKYGTRENRKDLEEEEIRASFRPLGRRPKGENRADRWFKAKQKERNRIEGSFGHGKQHCGMDRVKYSGEHGSEMWIRGCLLAMNLQTAARRV
ncbi:MAG: IS5 family transposase [Candidatus Omnitrophica bacterium]|nr:IS5 family transposase [Candidatus Omnitrophota bacterium]